jgi:hypothetical protein
VVEHGIGKRLEPGDGLVLEDLGVGVVGWCAEPGGEDAPASMVQRGDAGVGGNAVEPGLEGGARLEAVHGARRPEIGLLDDVLGVVIGAGHLVAVRDKGTPQPVELVVQLHATHW